jgi:hypothetical protein
MTGGIDEPGRGVNPISYPVGIRCPVRGSKVAGACETLRLTHLKAHLQSLTHIIKNPNINNEGGPAYPGDLSWLLRSEYT